MVNVKDKIRQMTPTDIMLAGILVGVSATVVGVSTWVDKNILNYSLGVKPKNVGYGALIGAVIALPLSYYSTTASDMAGLGRIPYNTNTTNVFNDPRRFDTPPKAPEGYIYANNGEGGQYLIVDPKYL